MVDTNLDALRSSVDRLRNLTNALSDDELTRGAYPSEWSIADVLSHLGSGAVITQRRLDDALAGCDTPDDFAPAIWDEWNAKQPAARRDEALVADAALIARLQSVTAEQRNEFTSAMGPITLDFDEFVGMRLNEHVLHTWDIEIVDDPAATIPSQTARQVVDNLELIAQFTATPTDDTVTFTVATIDPVRRFTIELTPDSVTFGPSSGTTPPDLQLTAEAFVRLVYGRLDMRHTPKMDNDATLDVLRHVFPRPISPNPTDHLLDQREPRPGQRCCASTTAHAVTGTTPATHTVHRPARRGRPQPHIRSVRPLKMGGATNLTAPCTEAESTSH